jgi:hypothetical protein
VDRPEVRALADHDDCGFDHAHDEKWLALAGTPERDDRASVLKVP